MKDILVDSQDMTSDVAGSRASQATQSDLRSASVESFISFETLSN